MVRKHVYKGFAGVILFPQGFYNKISLSSFMSQNYYSPHENIRKDLFEYMRQLRVTESDLIDVMPFLSNYILVNENEPRTKELGLYLHQKVQDTTKNLDAFVENSFIYIHHMPQLSPSSKRYIIVKDQLGRIIDDDETKGIYRKRVINNCFSLYINNRDIAEKENLDQSTFKKLLGKKYITPRQLKPQESHTYTHFYLDKDYFLDAIYPFTQHPLENNPHQLYHITNLSQPLSHSKVDFFG